MGRVSIKGVLLGIATDLVGTTVAGMVMFPLFGTDLLSQEMSPEELEEAVQRITQGGAFLVTSLIVGLSFSAVGGHVAARVAKKEIYLNAGLVGVFGVLFGLLFGGGGPIWYNVAGFLLVIPASLYGGYLADRRMTT